MIEDILNIQQLTAPRLPEQLRLVFRRFDLQQVALIATLVEADALLKETNQLKLGRLKLEVVHVEFPVHTAGVEQKMVSRDGEGGDTEQGT